LWIIWGIDVLREGIEWLDGFEFLVLNFELEEWISAFAGMTIKRRRGGDG